MVKEKKKPDLVLTHRAHFLVCSQMRKLYQVEWFVGGSTKARAKVCWCSLWCIFHSSNLYSTCSFLILSTSVESKAKKKRERKRNKWSTILNLLLDYTARTPFLVSSSGFIIHSICWAGDASNHSRAHGLFAEPHSSWTVRLVPQKQGD